MAARLSCPECGNQEFRPYDGVLASNRIIRRTVTESFDSGYPYRSRPGRRLAPRRRQEGRAARAIVGIDAQLRESGQHSGRMKMSKRGNRYLRRAVVLAARTAARLDPQGKALLVRQLQRGKHYNVAVSHVARKLVHIIYAVLRHHRPYTLPAGYRLGITVDAQTALASPAP